MAKPSLGFALGSRGKKSWAGVGLDFPRKKRTGLSWINHTGDGEENTVQEGISLMCSVYVGIIKKILTKF